MKTPVVIAGTNCLSGVTTWADRLRVALADHPRYEVKLLYIGAEERSEFDICVPTVEVARQVVLKLAPVILLPNYVWELFLAGFEPGVYCVGMCHADSEEQYYMPLSWYEPFISKFIGVSHECTEQLTRRLPFRMTDITMLPYGIAVPRMLNRDYQVEPLRLVYAGRVTQLQKRVLDFVPLVEHLLRTDLHFVFDIIGEGDHFSSLNDEMHDRFPAGVVRFHQRVPHQEMPNVWKGHDIFLQVSDFEGTSVSMLEAMAYGVVPVVTSASSGIAGVIRPSQNGFVVPVGDMAAMSDILARVVNNRAVLAKIGRAAHETAQAYSMEQHSKRFSQFLDQIIAADKQIDVYQRYGMFGSAHPLFQQRHLIVRQQEEITRLEQWSIQRILDSGYRRLIPLRVRQLLHKRAA
jgi:glycosyltransferase involved in cell wall biosynthesis